MTNTVGYEMRIESIKGWDKHLTPISPRSGCPEEGHLLPNSHAIIKFVTLYCQCLILNWMSESSISGHRNIGENLQGVSEARSYMEAGRSVCQPHLEKWSRSCPPETSWRLRSSCISYSKQRSLLCGRMPNLQASFSSTVDTRDHPYIRGVPTHSRIPDGSRQLASAEALDHEAARRRRSEQCSGRWPWTKWLSEVKLTTFDEGNVIRFGGWGCPPRADVDFDIP